MSIRNILFPLTRNTAGCLFRGAVARIFAGVLLLGALSANGQDRAALEKKREGLLNEIRQTERLLSKARSDVQATAADLSAINHKIKLREELIRNLEAEVASLNREQAGHQATIDQLNAQLEKLKENYGQSVYAAYKYQKTNQQLVFILGAESVNQAVRRLNYLRKLNQRRREQATEIAATTESVKQKIAELEKMKQQKTALLAENNIQMNSLADERALKDKFIARLKKDESRYRDEIKRKNDEAKKLDREIRLIIERELAARAKDAQGLEQTPEAVLQLSKDFYANKGKLPWPVEQGYVSRHFGKQPHPELKNLQIENNGIDIRTGKEAPVRVLFDGYVVSVFTNPVFKNAVIVKHGEYFTVYSKLGKVNVKAGDQVNTRDVIGHAFTENDLAEVHLEVWKGKTTLDPYTWIVRK